MLILYSLTLFLSATLLFTVEPMVGKMLLPRCGGTPAVWNTCMVFFQTVLLLSYGYAHVTTRLLGVRRQASLHLIVILLPLLVLAGVFSADSNPPAEENPSFWLLGQLTLGGGLAVFRHFDDGAAVAKMVRRDGPCRFARSVFSLFHEQRRQPVGAVGLSVPHRAAHRTYRRRPTFGTRVMDCLAALIFCCAIVAVGLSSRKTAAAAVTDEESQDGTVARPDFPATNQVGAVGVRSFEFDVGRDDAHLPPISPRCRCFG